MFCGARNTLKSIARYRRVPSILVAPMLAWFIAGSCNGQSPITITFEGLQDQELVSHYYNGGLGGFGSGPGPSDGINFGSDALATISQAAGGGGNFDGNPSGVTIVTFLSGPGVVMNVPAGFTTGFSFFYTSGPNSGVVTVYDGANGTGNILATLNLAATGTFCNGSQFYYSCWATQGISFSGVAKSIDFSGATNAIGFDDITLGSQTPDDTPPTGPILTITPKVSGSNSTLTPGLIARAVTVRNSGAAGIYNADIQGSGFQIQQAAGEPQAGQSQSLIISAGETQNLTVNFDTNGVPPGIYTASYSATPQSLNNSAVAAHGTPKNSAPQARPHPEVAGASAGQATVTVNGYLTASVTGLTFNLTGPQSMNQTVTVNEAAGYSIPVNAGYSAQKAGPVVQVSPASAFTPYFVTVQAAAGSLTGPSALGTLTLTCTTNMPCSDTPLNLPVIINSTAPSSITRVLPHFAVGSSFVSDIYLVNSGTSAANFSITFHDDMGNPVMVPFVGLGSRSTLQGSVPAGGASFYEAGTPSGTPLSGSAVVMSDPSITIQALFRRQSGSSYYEAAVPAASGSTEVQLPFDATTFSGNGAQIYTGLAIANLDAANGATVSCQARDSSGAVIPNAIPTQVLNPLGHWANYLFPALVNKRGTLDCTSTTMIGAIGIRALGTNALSSLPIITPPVNNSGAKVLPHFAVGGSFVSDFYVVNSGTSTGTFSITFHDDLGNTVAVPIVGLGNRTTLSGSVPAGGSAFFEAGTPNGTPSSGSALITSDPAITVQALFRRQSGGSYYEAAVPEASGGTEVQVPFDATVFSANSSQIYTGLAIANLDASHSANISCTAKDSNGNVIPAAIPAQVLNPLGHWANYLFAPLAGKRGTLDCTSDTQIGAIGIRALGTNALSTLPIIAQ